MGEDMFAVDAEYVVDEEDIETARIRFAALTWFQYNHARYICNNEWIYERIAVSVVIHKRTVLVEISTKSAVFVWKIISHFK